MFNSFLVPGEDIQLEGIPLEKADNYTYLDQLSIMNSNKETKIKKNNIT